MPYCPNCGREVKEGEKYCQNCGAPLTPPVPATPYSPMVQEKRPIGITFLAIFEVLGGLVFLILGVFMLVIASLLGRMDLAQPFRPLLHPLIRDFLAIIGVLMIMIGSIDFGIAFGYLNGQGWAWTLGMAFAALGILIGLLTLPGGIFKVIIDGAIIFYLTRSNIRAFFGK